MKCLSCAVYCPEVMKATGDLHHKISKLIPRVAEHILDNPTPFDSTYHMLNHNAHTMEFSQREQVWLYLALTAFVNRSARH